MSCNFWKWCCVDNGNNNVINEQTSGTTAMTTITTQQPASTSSSTTINEQGDGITLSVLIQISDTAAPTFFDALTLTL